jgi:hypothetical protein
MEDYITAGVKKVVNREYIVYDYGGEMGRFKKLKDARECLHKRGEGFYSSIEAVTKETIEIVDRRIIQTLD